jgi:acyl-CoA dehydrogenase family protein 9
MPTPSKPHTFLTDLYLGRFDQALFDSFPVPSATPETARLIAALSELGKSWPAAALEKEGRLPDQLRQELRELGLFGLCIPKSYGGLGLSLAQYLLVLQALAGHDLALAIIPTAHLSIGVMGLLLYGSEEQKQRYLPRAASGEMLFAYALTEPEIGSDAQHITTSASLSEDGVAYILNGRKSYITNGGYAGGLTVFAQMDPERPGFLGAFLVETATPGVRIGRELAKMGLTISSTTSITFEQVRIPRANLLGGPGDGFKIAMTILNYGRLGLGAASTGVMAQALIDMRDRAARRIQFGRPIGDFELIRAKLVQARVHGAVAEAMTFFTAHLLEHDPTSNLAIESSHAKLFGTSRAWATLNEAMQTAGGAGYLATLPYEKRLRDFRVTTIFEGTSEIHSIYPALQLFRTVGTASKGSAGLARLALRLVRGCDLPPLGREPGLHRAVAHIRRATRRINLLLAWGMMRHGHKLPERELYLARITGLSFHLYGVLCLLAMIKSRQRTGQGQERELRVLEYFLAEAEENLRSQGRLSLSKRERLLAGVFEDLAGAEVKPTEG